MLFKASCCLVVTLNWLLYICLKISLLIIIVMHVIFMYLYNIEDIIYCTMRKTCLQFFAFCDAHVLISLSISIRISYGWTQCFLISEIHDICKCFFERQDGLFFYPIYVVHVSLLCILYDTYFFALKRKPYLQIS